ncbi:hypothetical protein [Streptomyces specialis]|uniref:hypothetical protein n=1 Tax=Streptomyces specialis TaxID=498367 RepID=UPI00073E591D|nr:hypothetical protein [Streptomyces specialis]
MRDRPLTAVATGFAATLVLLGGAMALGDGGASASDSSTDPPATSTGDGDGATEAAGAGETTRDTTRPLR